MESKIIEELIQTIEEEIINSGESIYVCKNGRKIITDVGYIKEWFDEYKNILREKFSQ